MLCPEVWNFTSPKHQLEVDDDLTEETVGSIITSHYFNHSVSLVLPKVKNISLQLENIILEDSDFYQVDNVHLADLVDCQFINSFVKKGELSLLSINTRIDVDSCVCLTPSGFLVLSLATEDYEKLGLEGKPSFFDRKNPSRYYDKMPQRNKVSALQELALCSIGKYVLECGKAMAKPFGEMYRKNPGLGLSTLHTHLDSVKHELSSNVAWYLYNRMAMNVLNAVMDLINETKKSFDCSEIAAGISELNVAVCLVEVVLHKNLKTIEFSMWPKIMRHVLYNNLHNLTGLETLDLGSGSFGWRTSDIEKQIINGISNMPKLKSFTLCFDCTDNIIVALEKNCKELSFLDVTSSRSVTDRSINSLLKMLFIRSIKLFRTSLSINGLSELLLALPGLENIGRCDDIGEVLEIIYEKYVNTNSWSPLQLKVFESRNVTSENLHLLINFCPYITSLSIMSPENIGSLTELALLNNLVELKLLSCYFYTNQINNLLSLTHARLISLHLEHVEEIDQSALIYISQFCPKLKSLTFYNCDFLDRTSVRHIKLSNPPFSSLQRIKLVVDCVSTHLEFLLSHCTDIRFIQLGSSTGIDDTTMKKILEQNPMKLLEELKILYSADLSMKTVDLLIKNCYNLRRLSELENWHGISSSELAAFRDKIKINNIHLDISPTLSFA